MKLEMFVALDISSKAINESRDTGQIPKGAAVHEGVMLLAPLIAA